MESVQSTLKALRSPKCLVAFVGYALYRAVAYNSYVTGFFLADQQVGYISDLSFLVAASVGIIPTAAVVALYYTHRGYRPLSVGIVVPALLLVCSCLFSLSAGLLFSWQPTLILLGICWGVATLLLAMAWIEVLAINSSPLTLIIQLASASLFSAAFSFVLLALPEVWNCLMCCVLLALSMLALKYCRSNSQRYEPQPAILATTEALKQSSIPFIGSLLFEMVIGMMNMYAVASASVGMITASTPLLGMVLCAFLTILFVFAATRLPNPALVYLGVFPVVIAAFLLLPFFGSEYGVHISPLFYTGYIFTTLIANLYCLRTGVACQARLYVLFAVMAGCTRLALVIGLAAGYFFGSMQQGDEVFHLTFIAAVSVYLLGTAIVVFAFNGLHTQRNNRATGEQTDGLAGEQKNGLMVEPAGGLAGGSAVELAGGLAAQMQAKQLRNEPTVEPAGGPAAQMQAEQLSFDERLRMRANRLASEHCLTNRECDVLMRLALGNSANYIAEDLVLSTSTVNGYVKSIYQKLHVNKKQQVINMFNDIVSAPEPEVVTAIGQNAKRRA